MDMMGFFFGKFLLIDFVFGIIVKVLGGVGCNFVENLVCLGLWVELVIVFGDDCDGCVLL